MEYAIEMRRELHKIPELGFKEFKTQAFILNQIRSYPEDRVSYDTFETGIFVRVKGLTGNRTIGYRADIDGLPIEEATGLPFCSEHAGMMHACGHDVHSSIALGLLRRLVELPIMDDVVFLFQPAEEGPGGAEPMIKSSLFEKYRPSEMYGLHVAPEYPVGTIASRPGVLFASAREVHITIYGKSGHAAFPHLTVDTVVAQAALIMQLQTIISRSINPMNCSVITIGKVDAGIRENVIAGRATLDGTMRALNGTDMEKLEERVRDIVRGIEASFGVTIDLQFGNRYYEVVNDKNVVDKFSSFVKMNAEYVECDAAMTGEDFGFMLKEIPGMMFWLGINNPTSGLHQPTLNPDEQAIPFIINLMDHYFREYV